MQPRRPHAQRSPPMLTTTWPISPAAPRPSPGPAVEHDPAADAGAPEHAEQRAVRPAGAERELGVGRDLDVVAEAHARAERLLQLRAEGELALPVGQVARAGHGALARVDVAGRADARRPTARRSRRPPGRRPPQRRRHRGGDVRGPARAGVGWRAWPSTVLAASTTTAWILVPPRSMPPRRAPFGVLMGVML